MSSFKTSKCIYLHIYKPRWPPPSKRNKRWDGWAIQIILLKWHFSLCGDKFWILMVAVVTQNWTCDKMVKTTHTPHTYKPEKYGRDQWIVEFPFPDSENIL